MQDLNDKITGGTLTANEWNEVPSEIQNVIEALGITLSIGDLNQLGKAIAGYVANGTFYTDSGIADAYVLTTIGSKQTPPALTDGLEVNYVTTNPSTGGAVTVNPFGVGATSVKVAGGANPAAGEVSGRVRLVYDLANTRFQLDRTGMVITTVKEVSGTFNPQLDTKSMDIRATGGGAGGGASDGTAGTTAALASGGSAGGTCIKYNILVLDSVYTHVIGSAGFGQGGIGDGGDAGDTTVDASSLATMTGFGGLGGRGMAGITGSGGVTGRSGGAATGGDENIQGGSSPNTYVVTGEPASAGDGGVAYHGSMTRGVTNSDAVDAINSGDGGSGAGTESASTNFDGGNGKKGKVIYKEYL